MFDKLTQTLSGVFGRLGRKGRITESDVEEALREVRIALLEADVNLNVAKEFIASIKAKVTGQDVLESLTPDQTIIKIVYDEVVNLLGEGQTRFNWSPSLPTVVLLCGLQGSGKTTTAAKLALWLQKQGKKPVMVACDLQRPAAIKQLQVLGQDNGIPVFSGIDAKDPVLVAKQSIEAAKSKLHDVVILDTAGRLQIDEPLMQELQAIKNAASPSEVLLVADSTTGQEAVSVAKSFDERLDLSGLIFTKLDGDTRGGAVLSVRMMTGKPVRFIGTGESADALEPFTGERVAQRILGYGDILTLVEKAQEAIDRKEAKELEEKAFTGKFNFEDMLHQFKTIRKMGSFKSVLKLIPGMNQVPPEMLENINESGLGRVEAMILSMTREERQNPDILNASRRRRIAAGSGTSVQEVNRLTKQLEEMRKQMKSLSKMRDLARVKKAKNRK